MVFEVHVGHEQDERQEPRNRTCRQCKHHEHRAAKEASHLRDQVGQHRPYRGQRDQWDSQQQPDGKDVQAHHSRDGDRTTEVTAEGGVKHPPDRVGLFAVAGRDDGPPEVQQPGAIEQGSESDDEHQKGRPRSANKGTDHVSHRLVIKALRQRVEPAHHLFGCVCFFQGIADHRPAIELFNRLWQITSELRGLSHRRGSQNEHHDGCREEETCTHDGDGRNAVDLEAAFGRED